MNQYNFMQDKNKIQKHEKPKRDEKCDLSFYGIGRVGSSNYVTNAETSNECKHVYYNMYVNAFCEKKTFTGRYHRGRYHCSFSSRGSDMLRC